MKELVIIGAGGFARELAWQIELINEKRPSWKLLGFVDDDPQKLNQTFNGYKVLGNTSYIDSLEDSVYIICAIANTIVRKKIVSKLSNRKFATIIAPNVLIGNETTIGVGTVICSDSIITVNSEIGNHCICDFKSMIGHDTVLEDFVTLYPNVTIAGNVVIEEGVEMGTCSNTNQGIKIGQYTKIGSGAVVVNDIESHSIAVGIPAKQK